MACEPRCDAALRLTPSAWVVRFAPLIAPAGRVLDLACGYGRHARYLAAMGHRVLAIDRDEVALSTLSSVERIDILPFDLELGDAARTLPFRDQTFDAIVVSHYLYRPLFPHLCAALDSRGVLIYETFARGNEAYGRPSNPDFLLEPNELLDRFAASMRVIAFEQGIANVPPDAVIQRICAIGHDRVWPQPLPSV